MIIEKDRTSVGNYFCKFKTNDPVLETVFACGNSHTEALDRMFKKLQWANIGNWNES